MPRLIRMDHTGHSTLAEWTADDQAAYEAAVEQFRTQLDEGYIGVVDEAPAAPRRCASCRARPTW